MEIKLIDSIENPEKCIALKRIPHYALIKDIPCVLLSSVTSANEKVLYRSIQEILIEADVFSPYFQVDVVEITEETYKKMGGKELCTVITIYDTFTGIYPTVSIECFDVHRRKLEEELEMKYGKQYVLCIKNFVIDGISFTKGYKYMLSCHHILNGESKVDVLTLKERIFDEHFRILP